MGLRPQLDGAAASLPSTSKAVLWAPLPCSWKQRWSKMWVKQACRHRALQGQVWGPLPCGEHPVALTVNTLSIMACPGKNVFYRIFSKCQGRRNRWRTKNACINMAFPTLGEIKKIIKPTEMFLSLPVHLLHVNHSAHCSCNLANSSRWPGSAVTLPKVSAGLLVSNFGAWKTDYVCLEF